MLLGHGTHETQSELDLFGEILINKPSILVSLFLVVLGVLDILTSLACVALSAREACGSHSSHMGVFAAHDGQDKKERLYRWLGQQKNMFQTSAPHGTKGVTSVPQFVPLTSSVDSSAIRKSSSPVDRHIRTSNVQSKISKSSDPLSTSSGNSSGTTAAKENSNHLSKTSKISQSSSGVSSEHKNSSVMFIHPELQPEEKQKLTLVKKKHKKSCPHISNGPYSLPPMADSVYHHCHNREQQTVYSRPPHWDIYTHYAHPPLYYSLPCPQHQYVTYYPHAYHYTQHIAAPGMAQYPPPTKGSAYSAPMDRRRVSDIYATSLKENERMREKERIKKKKEKKKKKELREKRKNKPLTDEQIESSYTGLDREIAEGFISLAMEPAVSRRKALENGNDEDSF